MSSVRRGLDRATTLTSVEARRDLFRQHVLRSGAFALRYSRERQHDDVALGRQRDNILQAMVACDRYAGAWQTVVDIALALHDHMERRGYWEVWERCLERAVRASRMCRDAKAEATLLNHLGEIRRGRGRWESALALHEEALQIFERLQDEAGIAESQRHLGCLWWLRGRWDRASAHLAVALGMAEGVGEDEAGLAALYADVGRLCSYKGEWEKALVCLERAAKIAGRLGDTSGQIRIQSSMGYAHWRKGEWTDAKRLLQRAIEAAEDCGYETKLAIAYNNLAAVLLSQGDWKQALDYLERDLRIVEPLGAIHLAAHAYDDMGEAYRQAGQWDTARRYLERSAEIKRGLDDLSGLAATYHHLGLLCTDTGEHERALSYHCQALELRERLGAGQDIAEVLVSLAWARYRRACSPRGAQDLGQQQARDQLRSAIARARALACRLERRDLLTRLLWLEAEVASREGCVDRAHAAYARALRVSHPVTVPAPSSGHRASQNDRLIMLHRDTQGRMDGLFGEEREGPIEHS